MGIKEIKINLVIIRNILSEDREKRNITVSSEPYELIVPKSLEVEILQKLQAYYCTALAKAKEESENE